MDVLKRNNVKLSGRGTKPMILGHGFGCDQNMWRFIAPAFEDKYFVVLFDYVGSGKSDVSAYDPERYNDLSGYTQDVLEICEALNLTDAVFVGHSVSSMIGMLAAIQQPQYFDRLIMIGPSPCYVNTYPDYVGGFERADIDELLNLMDQNYLRWANTLAPAVMGHPEQPDLSAELARSFCSTDWIIMQQFARVTFFNDNRQDLPKLKLPVLILQCMEDVIAPAHIGEYIRAHVPDGTLRYMKATGHCPHLSAPAETIALMQEYLVRA